MTRESLTLFDFTPRSGALQPMGLGRPAGVHLGEIVRAMKEYAGEKVDSVEGEQEWFRAQVGFLWERALEYAFKEYMGVERAGVEHQIELEVDGIHMTPDGFDPQPEDLEEYKATWRTARKWNEDPELFWSWLVQVKGYLHGLSVRDGVPRRRARFYILFVNGDYKRGSGALPMGIYTERLTFTDEEVKENWANVLRYKEWKEAGGE